MPVNWWMPELQKEINIHPSGAIASEVHWSPVSHWWHSCTFILPALLKWVWGSAEMTASLTSTVWLSDTPTPDLPCFHHPRFFNCKKPKVCSVHFKGVCCFRNEKIRLCKVMLPLFCTFWTDLADFVISFLLLFIPAGGRGDAITCTPKSFCITVKEDFFSLLVSNFLS